MKRIGPGRYLLLLTTWVCADAFACVCLPDDGEQEAEKAALVFVGQPVKIEEIPLPPPKRTAWQQVRWTLATLFGASPPPDEPSFPPFLDAVRVTFEVSEYRKGNGPRRIEIRTGHGDSDCGLPVRLAKRYVIYARDMEGALRTSYCFGSDAYVPPRRTLPACKRDDDAGVVTAQ